MDLQRLPIRVYPPGYGSFSPASDYRPWTADMAFLRVWERIRSHTLVDQARLYELWELLPQVDHIPGDILEVGVWRGGSGALLGLRSSGRTLFLADTFTGVAKAGVHDTYYTGGEHADTSLDRVESFLHSLSLRNYELLPGVFPDETAHRIADRTFAFCHIDVDVYESAEDVFHWVWPRIPPGGIVVFDDYGFYGCEGVTALIHELRSRTDGVTVGNLNGHAVIVRTQERRTTQ